MSKMDGGIKVSKKLGWHIERGHQSLQCFSHSPGAAALPPRAGEFRAGEQESK